MLRIRHSEIVPRLKGVAGNSGVAAVNEAQAIDLRWRLGDGTQLTMIANLGDTPINIDCPGGGSVVFAMAGAIQSLDQEKLKPWSVLFYTDESRP